MGEGLKDRLRTWEDAYSGGLILYAWRRTETLTKATPHVHSGDGGLIRAAGCHADKPPVQLGEPRKRKVKSQKGRKSLEEFAASGAHCNNIVQTTLLLT